MFTLLVISLLFYASCSSEITNPDGSSSVTFEVGGTPAGKTLTKYKLTIKPTQDNTAGEEVNKEGVFEKNEKGTTTATVSASVKSTGKYTLELVLMCKEEEGPEKECYSNKEAYEFNAKGEKSVKINDLVLTPVGGTEPIDNVEVTPEQETTPEDETIVKSDDFITVSASIIDDGTQPNK